jgi:hypothetical protein
MSKNEAAVRLMNCSQCPGLPCCTKAGTPCSEKHQAACIRKRQKQEQHQAAVSLGRKRWAKVGKRERSAKMSELAKRRHRNNAERKVLLGFVDQNQGKPISKADFLALYDAITKAIK